MQNQVFFSWSVIVKQSCKPLSHAEGINWDLRELWRQVGAKPWNTGVFIVYTLFWKYKKSFQEQKINWVFVSNVYKYEANQKNIAKGIKKENLLLASYSHF